MAYLDNQSMAVILFYVCYVCVISIFQYHSDNEAGVGPTVAGLSLGSNARMSFRHKDTKQHILTLNLQHVSTGPYILIGLYSAIRVIFL